MKRTVVSLFDKTGNAVRPWAEAGYQCVCYDIQHDINGARQEGNITFQPWDALQGAPFMARAEEIAFVFAFPPCTHLAVSGARWFKGKGLRALAESIEMFAVAAEICEASGAPYMIENPVSTISSYWRKPDHTFHPWEYTEYELSDHYTKRTCLWTGGGFVMPDQAIAFQLEGKEPDNRIHAAPPSEDRADFRSATPLGFARAVFHANNKVSVEVTSD